MSDLEYARITAHDDGKCSCNEQDKQNVDTAKDLIIRNFANAGIKGIKRSEIKAEFCGDGGYSIDGMPWDEWRDAQLLD